MDDPAAPPLTPEERAAVRAYLQRSEVRLSTVHRVASALLSGAGLMVLLPAVERDSVVGVLRALLSGSPDAAHLLLVAAVAATLAVPFTALWLVVRDLTRFYFHANHIRHATGEAFTPRFALTGLHLPSDELGPDAARALSTARGQPHTIEVLVPVNDTSRARIDEQVAAYGGLGVDADGGDEARAAALFALAASRPRALLEEVAKAEHGVTRHVLRIQVIVLRYVKALLALLTTALAAFAAAAVVDGRAAVGPGEELWLASILLLWSPLAIAAVTSPVRWLEGQLRSEGASQTAVGRDRDLTHVETLTVQLALVGFVAAGVAMALVLAGDGLSRSARTAGGLVTVGSIAALAVALRTWTRRRSA